ncbi:hypothetical protein ACFQZO_23485 [Bradyrhizobium sp. GCM10027634]|uniref:hypothetical protein n=1 Tax=unclassified Bradyrhizobium TaxID=2631580 RepID=UPI00263B28A1|nr:hypothetical protein [Bradyrhizobium sp. WYCCWR 12677]MDN5003803.1 hypothetical protein [Bradyrhizobium sp. WYCCWR 12677]
MDVQQISALSSEDLDTVVGGMMNDGRGQFLQTPKNTGGPGMSVGQTIGELILTTVAIGFVAGL